MNNSIIRSISELANVDLTRHQQLRILSSSKPFCVIVDGFIHLHSDPRKLIRERYKDREAWEVHIYDLNS